MKEGNRIYAAIDLKSFYASVECVERGLDPLSTNLVVADESRTDKTICLAVSPSLKAYGISGRARLFEAVQRVKQVNSQRRAALRSGQFSGRSYDDRTVRSNPAVELDFIRAVPRMAFYIDYSTRIYDIYLKYVAPEDIHVYSIDEVFIDLTEYVGMYGKSARELTVMMIRDVLANTGITATAGIGTNLFLAKVAMDIVAKHIPADEDGVRIASLDEMSYRTRLWDHRPLTDFWRVGPGIAERLSSYGIDTMGKIARTSVNNEELLYNLFGVNAELLIDHAWGWEPCTLAEIKAYRPQTSSMSSGQVLHEPYTYKKARVVVSEMADAASLELVGKRLVTDQITVHVGYDRESLSIADTYHGPIVRDHYGRTVPKPVHGGVNLKKPTSSGMIISKAVTDIFDKIVDRNLLIRRLTVVTGHIIPESSVPKERQVQLDLFSDPYEYERTEKEKEERLRKERKMQEAMLSIKEKYGKNAIMKGISYDEGATGLDRNRQIGGHKA